MLKQVQHDGFDHFPYYDTATEGVRGRVKGFEFCFQSAINNLKCIGSGFECSGCETLDQIFLGYEHEDDPREGCQKRTRAHLVPVDEDVSDAVENPHRDGLGLRSGGEHHGIDELIPGPQKGDDG
jgi:hypothetical protein